MGRVFWLMGTEYGEHGETAQELRKLKNKQIIFKKGFEKEYLKEMQSGDAVVIDDLYAEVATKNAIHFNNLFTKDARHKGITIIFLTQNIFHQGGQHRTRNLNVQYLVIFKNPRDVTVIDYIARQSFSKNINFLRDAFRDATEDKPHGYLFLDFTQNCPEDLRVRTDIFNFEEGPTIYKQE